MVTQRQAMRAWHQHLEGEVGVDEATILTDRLEGNVTRDVLEDALRRQSRERDERFAELNARLDERFARIQHEMASAWRKDLLMVSIGQFFALAAAVGALAALS